MSKKKKTITAIIVTFNRKNDLIRCLDNVVQQSYEPDKILIIDNASTDGTLEKLSMQYHFDIDSVVNDKVISIGQVNYSSLYLYHCLENGGGSKGFYIGMKESFETFDTDLYWMMDDDGYPDVDCLSKLVKKSNQYDYVMPTSLDIHDSSKLSWAVRKKNGSKTMDYRELRDSWGDVMNFVTPFNGALLSRKCLKTVGYINPNFFIWGDEYDHYWRCKEKGIQPVTYLDAKFFHPSQKLPLVKICFGLFRAPYVNSKLRMVCLARNYTYIYKKYGQAYKIPLKFLQYSWLFLITRHLDFSGWLLYIKSVNDGLHGNFERHKRYLK